MLTVAVLGRVVVRRDGVVVPVPTGRTTELLVRLAVEGGRPVRAQRLAEELWPGGARPNTLQAKVSQLRRALRDPAAVSGGAAGYALALEHVDAVDALDAPRLAAEGAARLATGDPDGAATACRAGRTLFGACRPTPCRSAPRCSPPRATPTGWRRTGCGSPRCTCGWSRTS